MTDGNAGWALQEARRETMGGSCEEEMMLEMRFERKGGCRPSRTRYPEVSCAEENAAEEPRGTYRLACWG